MEKREVRPSACLPPVTLYCGHAVNHAAVEFLKGSPFTQQLTCDESFQWAEESGESEEPSEH